MSTLLIRLAAPMQSWGLDDKFERRGTAREPTKSGVLGLLAAALGIARDDDESLTKLSALRFGVRVDRPGQLLCDFHTAFRVKTVDSAEERRKNPPYVTRRYYLADAVFIAGVEGDDEALMSSLEEALNNPVYPPFLGRRGCPPEGRLSLGLRTADLETALREEPRKENTPINLVLDAQKPGMLRRRDIPVSFSQRHRKHGFRYVDYCTEHDPFSELEGDHDVPQ